MIVAGSANPLLLGQSQGYNLTKSLRFRSSASAYLNRTFSTPTNNKKWTWSGWIKRGTLSTASIGFFGQYTDASNRADFYFDASDNLNFYNLVAGSVAPTPQWITSQVFRDPSAWYHIIIVWDSNNATAGDRIIIYVNGTRVTAYSSQGTVTSGQASQINSAAGHNLGRFQNASTYFDGYMTEINFIDGQALTPSSFGQTSSTTGVWQPIKYTGTYGTNGFYLPFTNTTSTSTLGNDFSGNGNNWTTNNISLTSGSTYDSMTDVPTNTDTNTANYCVINPVNSVGTALSITAANLNFGTGSSLYGLNVCSMSIRDKTYFEITLGSSSTGSGKNSYCGVGSSGSANSYSSAGYFGDAANAWSLGYSNTTAYINNNGTQNTQSGTIANGDVFMYAVDPANGKIWFGRNGTWYAGSPSAGTGASYTNLPTEVFPVVQAYNSSTHSINFGQRPFSYTPPSGFNALNTFNLPTPTIGATASTTANKYMDATTYTGNGTGLGSTQTISNGNFQPDFIWIKSRNTADYHNLNDSVRGIVSTGSPNLFTNTTDAETTYIGYGISALTSTGFTLIGNGTYTNANTYPFVAWQWKANGSGSTNTAGSITSTVSANTTAGFSIVTYTGNNTSGATVGHGLGVVPAMVICKNRSAGIGSGAWPVWHKSLTGGTYYLFLNTTAAQANTNNNFTATPTSTVLNLGTSDTNNTATMVAYCFAEVAGYSAFGSYTGNGSSDGPFVFTGFRPKYIMVKKSSNVSNWQVLDSSRSPYNLAGEDLLPNASDAEKTIAQGFNQVDMLSNGFKIRNTNCNDSGGTYIYACFAESPFKYANAR